MKKLNDGRIVHVKSGMCLNECHAPSFPSRN